MGGRGRTQPKKTTSWTLTLRGPWNGRPLTWSKAQKRPYHGLAHPHERCSFEGGAHPPRGAPHIWKSGKGHRGASSSPLSQVLPRDLPEAAWRTPLPPQAWLRKRPRATRLVYFTIYDGFLCTTALEKLDTVHSCISIYMITSLSLWECQKSCLSVSNMPLTLRVASGQH